MSGFVSSSDVPYLNLCTFNQSDHRFRPSTFSRSEFFGGRVTKKNVTPS